MGNEVLTIFLKKAQFLEKIGKTFRVDMTIFWKESFYAKNEYNLFYRKLDAKNFYMKQFFWKKQYFLRELQKTVLGSHSTISQGKGSSKAKN